MDRKAYDYGFRAGNAAARLDAPAPDAAWWNVDAVLAEPAGEQIIESGKLQ